MNIKIDTNSDLFYRQLLELLSNFNPIKKLRTGEIKVLSEIMKQHYNFKDVVKSDHLRKNLVFSQDTKQIMCENLGISRDTFNTNLSILRKKGVLNKDNSLIKVLNIFPEEEFKFEVTFKLRGRDE